MFPSLPSIFHPTPSPGFFILDHLPPSRTFTHFQTHFPPPRWHPRQSNPTTFISSFYSPRFRLSPIQLPALVIFILTTSPCRLLTRHVSSYSHSSLRGAGGQCLAFCSLSTPRRYFARSIQCAHSRRFNLITSFHTRPSSLT